MEQHTHTHAAPGLRLGTAGACAQTMAVQLWPLAAPIFRTLLSVVYSCQSVGLLVQGVVSVQQWIQGTWGFDLGQCMCGSDACAASLAVPMGVDVGHHSAHAHQLRSTALLVATCLPLLSAT